MKKQKNILYSYIIYIIHIYLAWNVFVNTYG